MPSLLRRALLNAERRSPQPGDRAIVAHFAEAAGREAPSRARDLGWGSWVAGGAAIAALGYAARRTRQGGEDAVGAAQQPTPLA